MAVLKPSCDARMAVTYPPGPLPTTIISYEFMKCNLNLLQIYKTDNNFKSYFFSFEKSILAALTQYRSPVDVGPSLNKCP